MNNHPFSYTYDNELEKVLTLSHLYWGRSLFDKPDNLADDEQIPELLDSEFSVKRWKHLKIINERFCSR